MRTPKHRPAHKCDCEVCKQHPYSGIAEDHRAINRVLLTLDEKHRRRFVGVLAHQWGHGGIQRAIAIAGLSRNTIRRGYHEAHQREPLADRGRVRRRGGGRLPVEKNSRAWKRP